MCIRKLVYNKPLPLGMDRQMFQPLKGCHCIYHYGNAWYEITLSDFSSFSVSRHKFPVNGKPVILYDYILDNCAKPLPPEIARLPKDSPVVLYSDKREDKMSAAALFVTKWWGTTIRLHSRNFRASRLRRTTGES